MNTTRTYRVRDIAVAARIANRIGLQISPHDVACELMLTGNAEQHQNFSESAVDSHSRFSYNWLTTRQFDQAAFN